MCLLNFSSFFYRYIFMVCLCVRMYVQPCLHCMCTYSMFVWRSEVEVRFFLYRCPPFSEGIIAMGHHAPIFPWIPEI